MPQHNIPRSGNTGENGTLKGRFLFGSVFLKIKTATQTIINDVNVPKLQSSAAVEMSKNVEPIMHIRAARMVTTYGVLCFG